MYRVFYGWWNVGASFIGLSLSYAMFTNFAFGVFVGPIETEFGWSRASISIAYTLTNITIVVCSPLVGTLVDRYGARNIVIPSVCLMGLAVAAMYFMQDNILQLYAMYILIPLFGAGTLPLTYSRVIVAWFSRLRGTALGISLAGFGVGAMLVPPAGQWLIEHYGWREAYLAFAAAIFLINLPITFLLLRESPKVMGLLADGDPPDKHKDQRHESTLGLSGKEALHTRSYWYILGSFALVGLGITSIIAHLVPMLIGRGIEPSTASLYMGALGAGLIVGRILAGVLMDRYFAPYVTAVFLSMMCFGVMVLALNIGGPLILVAVVLIGLALGSEISEIAYLVSRYFGPRAFGQINGMMFAAFQLGSAFGPPVLGLYFDRTGHYIGALWGISIAVIISIILILNLGQYPDLKHEKPV